MVIAVPLLGQFDGNDGSESLEKALNSPPRDPEPSAKPAVWVITPCLLPAEQATGISVHSLVPDVSRQSVLSGLLSRIVDGSPTGPQRVSTEVRSGKVAFTPFGLPSVKHDHVDGQLLIDALDLPIR